MASCNHCGRAGTLRCGGCHDTYYCSKTCQKAGWSNHKHLCKSLKDFQDRPTPANGSECYVRAIVFRPGGSRPHFVWLKQVNAYPGFLVPHIGALLAATEDEVTSGEYLSPMWSDIDKEPCSNRLLNYTIRLLHRDGFLDDTMKVNQAIRKVSDPLSPYCHDWKGPLIAYGLEHVSDNHPHECVDLVPSDLRYIAKFFDTYLYHQPDEEFNQRMSSLLGSPVLASAFASEKPDTVTCVRINCDGDVKYDKRPRFELMDLPAVHGIFHQRPTPISARIEFPICVARIPGSVEQWQNRKMPGGTPAGVAANQAATFLHICCDPNADDEDLSGESWGFASMIWDYPVGAVIVARKDKKPLAIEHVAALTEWCQYKLSADDFQMQKETDGDPEVVLREITKEKFEGFYDAWTARQDTETKRNRISPYEI